MKETRGQVALVPQPFESEIFGGGVFRLDVGPGPFALADLASVAREAGDLVQQDQAVLVSCRLSEGDPRIAVLRRAGFREIEHLVRFEREVLPAEVLPSRIRVATTDDRDACVEVARSGFSADRFHADPYIEDCIADEIKAAWVRNCFAGRSDLLLVGEDDATVTGFVACRGSETDGAVVDLIAVAKEHRGRGWGGDLLRGCLASLPPVCRVLSAGTQANNTSSIQMYVKLGFRPVEASVTMHLTKESAR